jgi:phosphoribosylcarboxyaminoimidazole (NCAIR) mutase
MSDDLEQPAPTDLELSRQVKDAAIGAVRILGREKRALQSEVEALRARLAEAEER